MEKTGIHFLVILIPVFAEFNGKQCFIAIKIRR